MHLHLEPVHNVVSMHMYHLLTLISSLCFVRMQQTVCGTLPLRTATNKQQVESSKRLFTYQKVFNFLVQK
jgi:hypothetical protein